MVKQDTQERRELVGLLRGTNAHMSFEEVVDRFAEDAINAKAPHVPYSPWHLVEHMRIAQWDILRFIHDPDHVSPVFPDGYRPHPKEKATLTQWRASVRGFLTDRTDLENLARDERLDLHAPIPHAPNYTIYREILTVSNHNSYHIGELAMLRQVLRAWPSDAPYLTGR
ncbi:MAG: DinB family protein [Chitinivibrionales bacterium]|nr:DinB family protein [Chitinivibrionales bacterium]